MPSCNFSEYVGFVLRYLTLHRSVCKYALSLRVQKKKNELLPALSHSKAGRETQQTNETQTFAIFPYSSVCREKVQYCLLVSPLLATDNWDDIENL